MGVELAQDQGAVLSISVDRRVHALAGDPGRSQQWALDRLRAESVWRFSTGVGVRVAVVDTGVRASHPDLSGQVLPGEDLVGAGDGRTDPNGHGTHVAGIIAAVRGNGRGIVGLAPRSKILPVRVLDAGGSGWDSDVANGIVWAADHGASIINLSLGGSAASSAMQTAVSYARSRGTVVVAAAGNHRQDGSPPSYPAAFSGVMAVAATKPGDGVTYFSNRGSYLDVAAPGQSVLSTVPPSTYASWSGTSMASPYAAATVALVRSVAPGLSGDQSAAAVTGTAKDLGKVGWDQDTGAGLVRPLRAVCRHVTCVAGR